MTKKFEGLFPALITPFTKDGEVDVKGLGEVVNYLIEKQKVDGLYITGSTGEFLLLSHEQKKLIMKEVAKVAKKRVTLIAQIGSDNLDEVVELAQLAKKYKYDAISAITPYYYSFSFNELKLYYQTISEASDLPMFIYYLPQLAGAKVNVQQFGELLEIKNVVGSKYGSTDLFQFERLMHKYGKTKIFMFAYDEALSLGLLLGAKGFIGSTYNVNAIGARKIIDAFNKKDLVTTTKLAHKYNDYIAAVLQKGLMQTLKAVLKLQGVKAGFVKKPFMNADEKEINAHAKMIIDKHLK